MIDPYFLGQPDEPGLNIHLLLDEFAIEDRWDAERVQNEALRDPRNPVLVPDQPWEKAVFSPVVLYDGEARLFRMWYGLSNMGAYQRHGYGPYVMAYAESENGVDWHKPLGDRYPYGEFERTNIVFAGRGNCQEFLVTYAAEPLSCYGRFMCTYKDVVHEEGFAQEELNDFLVAGHVCLAFSDDGVEWRAYEGNPVSPALDAKHDLYWDARLEHWIMVGRPFARAATEDLYRQLGGAMLSGKAQDFSAGLGRAEASGSGIGRAGAIENVRTRITIALSPDLKTWYPPREVLMPDARDDEEQMFFDHMAIEPYGGQYLGFLGVQPRWGEDRGWIELPGSADGLHWHRPRQATPFLAPGPEGAWDAGHVWAIRNVVAYGEWIYLYYSGSSRPWRYRYPDNMRAIGMARIRRDRFAGYYGGVDGAHLLSREVIVAGPRLLVNCSAQMRNFSRVWDGSLHTELVERTGRAIEGYTYAECDANHVDDLAVPITWQGRDLSALVGRRLYLRFFLRNMYLFGFRFAELV